MKLHRILVSWTAVLLLCAIGWGLRQPTAVAAQSVYPKAFDPYVNDYAEVISSSDETQIRNLLAEYEASDGVQMTVLTVRSLSDYSTPDESIEAFATNLFNEWGIGAASRNDGVLFLVAVEDRELRIELGAGYGSEDNGRMQRIIDQVIVPYFRQDNYSLGIHEGTRAVVAGLRGEVYESLAETRGGSASSQNRVEIGEPTVASRPSVWTSLGPILLGLGAVGTPLGGLLFYRHRRYKTRLCPQCQTEMVRLDEQADNAYLDQGQIAEEVLSSVDYDVWLCQNCEHNEVIPYKNWLQRYKSCHKCGYRTMIHSSTVVYGATYTSTGLRRNRDYCSHCRHERVTESVIPMRVRSDDNHSGSSWRSSSSSSRSSSSRSSFGGGRSSGSGASGKW